MTSFFFKYVNYWSRIRTKLLKIIVTNIDVIFFKYVNYWYRIWTKILATDPAARNSHYWPCRQKFSLLTLPPEILLVLPPEILTTDPDARIPHYWPLTPEFLTTDPCSQKSSLLTLPPEISLLTPAARNSHYCHCRQKFSLLTTATRNPHSVNYWYRIRTKLLKITVTNNWRHFY